MKRFSKGRFTPSSCTSTTLMMLKKTVPSSPESASVACGDKVCQQHGWAGMGEPSSPEACTAPHLHSSHLQVHRRDFGDDDCRDRQCSCGALQLNVLQTPCPACPMAQERRCSPELFPSSSWGAVGFPSPDTTLLTALCCLGSWAEPRSKEQLMDAVS